MPLKALTCLAITVLAFLSPARSAADPRTHDGFFLRRAASYAPFSDGIRGKSDSTVFGSDSNATGQGVLFEALAGGTTKPTGLLSAGKMVYGGGMLFATLPSFTLTANGSDVPANLANAFGVFFYQELYPVAEGGVGVQSMLGLAHLSFGLSDGTAQSATVLCLASASLKALGFPMSGASGCKRER